jgi:transposase
MDVHMRQTTFCVLDEDGRKIKTRTVRSGWRTVVSELGKLGRPFAVCYEASTGYGVLFDRLSKIARRVEVAHPGHLRLIFKSKRKNDIFDAEKLAKILYLNVVPRVHVPAHEVRAWRATIKHRHKMVCERTRSKNAIRALLRGLDIAAPRGLWTKKGLAWIEELAFDQEGDALRRDILLERLRHQVVLIKRVEKWLGKTAKGNPAVRLLMTIPGVGIRTAEAVAAWVDKPKRFRRNKSYGCYFGVVPCENTSAGRDRLGRITKQGPSFIRQFLVEAAWQGRRHSPVIRAYFDRVKRDDPNRNKIAIVATAHYMLRVMGAMLTTGELWRDEAA